MSDHLENAEKNKIVCLEIMTFLKKYYCDKVLAEKWKSSWSIGWDLSGEKGKEKKCEEYKEWQRIYCKEFMMQRNGIKVGVRKIITDEKDVL